MDSDLIPRSSDPTSSNLGLMHVKELTHHVLTAIKDYGYANMKFTDSMLTWRLRQTLHDETIDRGHVARARLRLERRGIIRRVNPDTNGYTVLWFEVIDQ